MDEPLIEPRLIHLLEKRPRLVDRGIREELLHQFRENVAARRTPEKVGERISREMVNNIADTTEPVVRDRARNRMTEVNDTVFRNL